MIEVKNLCKTYGNHNAITDLTFTIGNGHIYGFLGPNGAGKSTTMNIITGCLAATSGSVLIDGFDILENSVEAKNRIGYLPEQPPVFGDMTPTEYLYFIAAAKKIKKEERKNEIDVAMKKTGIAAVKDRLIKNLSKGYKQRVGIAQAILGNPSIIILDEPTVGLDPKQIIEIRNLISELGKEHTVILSSHILSEIQAVCDEILIISNGRLVACDTSENLVEKHKDNSTLEITAKTNPENAKTIISSVEGVSHLDCKVINENCTDCNLVVTDETVVDKIFFAFAEKRIVLSKILFKGAILEDLYLKLTGDNKNIHDKLKDEVFDHSHEEIKVDTAENGESDNTESEGNIE